MEVEMSVDTMIPSSREEVFGNMENTLPRRAHQCVTCSKSFSAPSKLQRHILSHTGQKPFGCHFCEKAYRQLAHLKLHINTHFSQRHIPQRESNANSDSGAISTEKASHKPAETDGLNADETPATNMTSPTTPYDRVPESVLCSSYICQPNPSISPSLHTETESYGTQPLQEEQISGQNSGESCKEAVDENKSVTDATVDKHGDITGKSNSSRTVHQCPECFKCFSAPSKLKRHCLIHTGQRPFQCSVCCSAFRQLSHLKAHSSIHSAFAKRSSASQPKLKSLAQHQRSQTWPRNYACSTCGRKYRQMRHLIVHQLTHKVPEISVQLGKLNDACMAFPAPPMCSASQGPLDLLNADSSGTLNEKRQVSDEALGRDSPGGSTSQKQQNATKDGERGDGASSSDPNVFNKRKKSSLSKSVKGNQCMVCQKKFEYPSKLSRHLLVHMGIKPFKCQVCGKSFRQRCHLQNHQQIHKLKSCLSVQKQWKNREKRSRQQSDVASEPLKTNADSKRVGGFQSQYGSPVKHDVGQCSSESFYSIVAQPHAWDHGGNMLSGMECGAVDRHISGELVPLKQDQSSDYGNASQVFAAMPAHQPAKPRKLISQNKPSVHGRGHGYGCAVCSKHFSAPSKLRRHSLTHVGQKTHQCPVCSKTFRQNAHLKTHMAFHEQGNETELSVDVGVDRKTEPLFVGPEEYECPISSNSVTSHTEDKQMESVSQTEVSHCSNDGDGLCIQSEIMSSNGDDLASTVPATSTRHTTTNGSDSQSEKPSAQRKSGGYQCALCLKTFEFPSKLSRHLLVHMGIKPFRCQVCSKSFRQLCHLQNHQKIHNRASWHESHPREAGATLTQQDQRPSSDNSVPERHLDFTAAAPHQDQTAAGQTYGDQQRNGQHYEQNADESYSRFCSTGRSNLENLNLSFDYEPTLPLKLENMNHIKSESNSTFTESCISPSKREKSAWNMTEEKHVDISPDEYHEQGNHAQFQNPYFPQQETADDEQMHQAPRVDEHGQTSSQEIANDPDHKLYLYQSTMTPPYCHSEYGVKEERMEVRLRSEVNLAYTSETPKDLHVCPGCGQCFTTKRKLSLHRCAQKQSQKERQPSSYQCAICYKSFEAPSKLKRHYLIHTGQRPFQCTVCEKAFTQSGHLKTHLLTHR